MELRLGIQIEINIHLLVIQVSGCVIAESPLCNMLDISAVIFYEISRVGYQTMAS